jgi:hypothetical protein
MAKRVADVLVDTLARHGVERIYGVAGDSLNGITDSIRPQERSGGCTCGTRRRPRLQPAPTRISPGSSPSAREAAVPATCT